MWAADLSAPGFGDREVLLSADERARAERLRFALYRRRFRAARWILRRILSRYLGAEPDALVFQYGPLGKPDLAGRPLRFNLSHTEDLALVAVTASAAVGVDVERIRRPASFDGLVRRVLSKPERHRLEALPEAERPAAFFRVWTRKEAWIKSRGAGVFDGLGRIEVTLGSGEPARLLACGLTDRAPGDWSLYHLDPASGFVGAVAIEGPTLRLRTWRWEG